MRPRHPVPPIAVPTRWLMTDERLGEALWAAVRALPRGAGIVFRHHATPPAERRRLFRRLRRLCHTRGLVLLRAGAVPLPGEMGTHGRRGARCVSWPAHDRRQAIAGLRAGAGALFVSPVFATRSHPGAAALGPRAARRIAQGMPLARIALGGVDARRYARLSGFDGWAAIDAWAHDSGADRRRRQKRKAVPT